MSSTSSSEIAVYADWDGLPDPMRLGFLYARHGAGREVFEFAFAFYKKILDSRTLINLKLDPRLGIFEVRQHPAQGYEIFGIFSDSSPDRWGRLLMRRLLEREQRAERLEKSVRLHESDYLASSLWDFSDLTNHH